MRVYGVCFMRSLKNPPMSFKNGHDPPKAQMRTFFFVVSPRAFFISYILSNEGRFLCLTADFLRETFYGAATVQDLCVFLQTVR